MTSKVTWSGNISSLIFHNVRTTVHPLYLGLIRSLRRLTGHRRHVGNSPRDDTVYDVWHRLLSDRDSQNREYFVSNEISNGLEEFYKRYQYMIDRKKKQYVSLPCTTSITTYHLLCSGTQKFQCCYGQKDDSAERKTPKAMHQWCFKGDFSRL